MADVFGNLEMKFVDGFPKMRRNSFKEKPHHNSVGASGRHIDRFETESLGMPKFHHFMRAITEKDDVDFEDEDDFNFDLLPKSCHDLEFKEMSLLLQQQQNARAAQLPSCIPEVEADVDPNDLEVQMITEKYELEQRLWEERREATFKMILESLPNQMPPEVDYMPQLPKENKRMPFTKNFKKHTSTRSHAEYAHKDPWKISSLEESGYFLPVLTPQSQAMRDADRSIVLAPVQYVPPTKPTSRKTSESINTNFIASQLSPDFSYIPHSHAEFLPVDHPTLPPLPHGFGVGSPEPESVAKWRTDFGAAPSAALPIPIERPNNLNEQTECLASQMIECLFTPQGKSLPTTPSFATGGPSAPKCSRLLDMRFVADCSLPSPLPTDDDAPPALLNKLPTMATEEPEEDSWETLDDATLDEQLAQLKLKAERETQLKCQQPPRPSVSSQKSIWDSTVLPNVLELYSVPKHGTVEAVLLAFDKKGFTSADVKMLDNGFGIVTFDTEREARDAENMIQHQWIKLRQLRDATKSTRDFCLKNKHELSRQKRPQTSAAVARRLVENTLGIKSTISSEKKQQERNAIKGARGCILVSSLSSFPDAKKTAENIWK